MGETPFSQRGAHDGLSRHCRFPDRAQGIPGRRPRSSFAIASFIFKTLGMEKDVRLVSVGSPSSKLAALKTGAIDAFVLTGNPVANIAASGEIRSVASINDLLPKKFRYINSHMISARRDYLEKNSNTVGKTVKVILQAADFLTKNPSWVLAKLKSEWKYDRPVAKMLLGKLKYKLDGKINPEGVKNAIGFLLEYKVLKEKDLLKIKIKDVYTTRFTG